MIVISIQHLFLFILPAFARYHLQMPISIQHLFLFIGSFTGNITANQNFNTTLVFIYRSTGIQPSPIKFHFNTTLVFIYPPRACKWCFMCTNFNTTLVFIYQYMHWWKFRMLIFQYNTCFYLSNVFPPFLISIIVIFPDKFNVSLNFSQPFLFFRYFLSNRLPTAILSGLPAFRIFFRLGKPIKAAHPAAFILHYLN